jgi:hypothetical protein
MKVSPTRIAVSPERQDCVRYSATVEYDDGKVAPEEYWFDFDASVASDLVPSGNPWLALLTPIAALLGEPLRISDPVDPLLFEGIHENMRVWKVWYPEYHELKFEVTLLPRMPAEPFGRVASFFSGGADSFFSVLFHEPEEHHLPRVDELISIWGFDIPLTKPQEIDRAQASLATAAKAMRKSIHFVRTNIRETRLNAWDWDDYTHGTSLVAVGLCLEKRYWRILVPANWGPTLLEMKPNGQHALTESNYSTQRMRFSFDGTSHSRNKKLGYLSNWPVAMEHLRLCWEGLGASNCSMCSKCTRSMIGLAAYGALAKCKTLDASRFSLDRVRSMRARTKGDVGNFELLLKTLPDECDPELRVAVELCLKQNQRYFARLAQFEALELTPWLGWLFGHYKRRVFMDSKR